MKTRLENPTQFHVTENQKRQIHLFLHNSGKVTTAQSMPALTTQIPGANMVPTTVSGSAPVDPDSPLSMGLSSATNSISDFNEVWTQLFLFYMQFYRCGQSFPLNMQVVFFFVQTVRWAKCYFLFMCSYVFSVINTGSLHRYM